MNEIDLFIGNFIDSDTNKLPNGVSLAGNYYQKKIRSILNISSSISLFYSENDKGYEYSDKVENIILKRRRHVFNVFNIIKSLKKLSKNRKKNKTILFYNLSIYSLVYYIYYVFFIKAKVVILLTDAGFLLEKNVISRLLSKFMSYAYGILALREIREIRKFRSKVEIMPGIISKDLLLHESKKISNTVLLSGSLGATTGLILALEYFSSQTQLKLYITGVPYLISDLEFEGILNKYKSNSISYLGVLDYKDYISVLTSAEFTLSLRNPKEIEHQYNFPSKILEYMSYGNIVISSLKYPELIDDIYIKTDYSLNGLKECFEKILCTSANERDLLASNARNYVKNHFSEEVLMLKIENLFK